MRVMLDWDPERDPENVIPKGRGGSWLNGLACDYLGGMAASATAEARGRAASAMVDLQDFADDVEFWLEGLRRGYVTGYTLELRDLCDMADLAELEADGSLSDEGKQRLAELRAAIADHST